MRTKPYRSTKPYFRLPFLIAAIAVVTASTWLIGWRYIEQSLLRTAGEGLALSAGEIAVQLDRIIYERHADMLVMSKVLSRENARRDRAFLQTYLDHMRATYGVYHWLGVADRSGRIIASSPPGLTGTDASATPWFTTIRSRAATGQDATYIGGVEAFATEEGAPDTLSFSAPIHDEAGTFQGAVTSRVSIPALETVAVTTISSLRSMQTSNSTLADIEYQIVDNVGIAYIDSDLLHKGLTDFAKMPVPSFELGRKGRSGFLEEDHQRRHVRVMTGYSRTQGWGQADPFHWTVLIRMPTASLVAPIQAFHFKIGAAGLAILVPIFWLLMWMKGRLRKEWRVAQAERLRATAAQAQYHLLLQTTDQGIFGLDDRGRCTFINRAAAGMLGYDPDDLLGKRLHEQLHQGSEGASCSHDGCMVLRVLSTGRGERLTEQTFRRKDGASFDVECSAFPLGQDGSRTAFVFTCMDIVERKQRTHELLQYQARLQRLAGQLRNTEEQVRQRLATELHDNLAQTLALCHMKLASFQRMVPTDVRTSLAPVAELIKEALRATRELMGDLRPPTLGNEGDLATAVQWVTAKLERHGLGVTVIDDRKPKPLDPDMLRIAHQSLHELLFNVLKHAQATSAVVRLRRIGGYLAMQVRDHGIGFTEQEWKAPTQAGSGCSTCANRSRRPAAASGFHPAPTGGPVCRWSCRCARSSRCHMPPTHRVSRPSRPFLHVSQSRRPSRPACSWSMITKSCGKDCGA